MDNSDQQSSFAHLVRDVTSKGGDLTSKVYLSFVELYACASRPVHIHKAHVAFFQADWCMHGAHGMSLVVIVVKPGAPRSGLSLACRTSG